MVSWMYVFGTPFLISTWYVWGTGVPVSSGKRFTVLCPAGHRTTPYFRSAVSPDHNNFHCSFEMSVQIWCGSGCLSYWPEFPPYASVGFVDVWCYKHTHVVWYDPYLEYHFGILLIRSSKIFSSVQTVIPSTLQEKISFRSYEETRLDPRDCRDLLRHFFRKLHQEPHHKRIKEKERVSVFQCV